MNEPEIIFNKSMFTNVFWKIKACIYRYVIIWGSSASSKSFSLMQFILVKVMSENCQWLFIRKYGTDIENSIFDGLKGIIAQWGLTDRFNFTFSNAKREVVCKRSGSRILFKGLDDPEKIKSIFGIKYIAIEEATQLTEEDWRELNRRVRGIKGIQIYLVFNPIVITHWIKKVFFDGEVYKTKTGFIHATYKDNPFLTQDDIEELENLKYLNENDYKIYTLGQWGSVRTGQEFYSAFNIARHVKRCVYIPGIPLHISFDQNVIPYITMTIYQIHEVERRWKVNQLDELCLSNPWNKTEDVCKEFEKRYGSRLNYGLYYYGDASGKSRDTRSHENDYDIVERVLARYLSATSNRVGVSNPSVNKRREFANQILAGLLPIDFAIDPQCVHSIEDFQMVQEDPEGKKYKRKKKDNSTGIPYEEYGHTSDSFDYFIMDAFQSYLN